jgi:putative lipoprotein (rSAM/lipoprotein system)
LNRLEGWLLRILGSVLGLAAIGCAGAPAYGSPAPEYGAPMATYHLGGTVTDAKTGTPIAGIRITFQGWIADSAQDGTFTLNTTAIYCTTCPAKAADVDGTLNGSYQDKDVPLTLVQTGPGDGHWFYGTYEQKGLAIKLDPKP